MELSEIREQSAKAAEQVCEAAKLKIGDLFVVGCSSSEILGEKIGTHSSTRGMPRANSERRSGPCARVHPVQTAHGHA